MRRSLFTLLFVLVAVAADAQSPYVAATIGADISRFSRTESNAFRSPSDDSEVVSWSLRLGTDIGQNWGTELEFVRSGESHSSVPTGVPIPFAGGVLSGATPEDLVRAIGIASPIANLSTDVRRSHSDFDGVAWARQRVNGSIDLVYLGGVAFGRQRTEISQTFPTGIRALVPIPGGAFRTTTIDYSVRPLIGTEARIGLTSHVRLIPGIRLQGLANGWLLRPYAGLGWFF
jgi:hypothetical protein